MEKEKFIKFLGEIVNETPENQQEWRQYEQLKYKRILYVIRNEIERRIENWEKRWDRVAWTPYDWKWTLEDVNKLLSWDDDITMWKVYYYVEMLWEVQCNERWKQDYPFIS